MFDLKGSSVGRDASAKDKEKPDTCVYKDNDLLQMGIKVHLGDTRRKQLLS